MVPRSRSRVSPPPIRCGSGRSGGVRTPVGSLFGGSNESTFQQVQRLLGGIGRISGAIAGVVLASICGVAAAQPAPARPSDAPLPSCLDQTIKDQLGADLKPRGVQKRDFIKNKKIVVVGHGGLYGGDLTSSTWIAGGSLGFFFTEDLGVNVEVDLTPLTLDLDSPLNKFFGDNRFTPGMAYVGLANLMWSPIHAKLKLGGGIVHSDIMVFAGGGRMFHDAVQGLSFDAGSAIDVFVTHSLTIRLDVRDLMAVEEISGETRYTNNLIATAGLALYLPSGL
jgi:outer membrane beta-barrel protein